VSRVRYELGSFIPEDGILHSHHHENLKSYVLLLFLIYFLFIVLQCVNINYLHIRTLLHSINRKGEAIAVRGPRGPQDREMVRLPHFLDYRLTDVDEAVSLMCDCPSSPESSLVLISVRS
jgi:hypothetical protein